MLRLLDYGKPAPFGDTIGKSRSLAWPVNVYRVTLPRTLDAEDRLNAFECVILKLLDATGLMNANALADETRIPLDLVKSILLRLRDKGLIDENNAVIERELEEEKAPVFVTALLFRELATGKILPFLHWLDDVSVRKKEGDEKDFWKIRWNDAYRKTRPVPRDVINALRAMKKRSNEFGWDVKMPRVQQIMIAAEPEFLHLDCPIAIQKSDGEFRIADPFGNGFTLMLENAFEKLLEQDEHILKWLSDWKHDMRTQRLEKQSAPSKEPFDTDSNWQRYPKLIANLRTSRASSFRSITQIHAAIEWALFYACYRLSTNSAVARLKFTKQNEHAALLAEAAKALGLELPPKYFREIRAGKLQDFEEGKAYQETVLAIALLQSQGNDSHPLHHLASKYPDLIKRLHAINIKRNEKEHGKGGSAVLQQELADEPFMREVIHTLVPDIVFADTPITELDKDLLGDELLSARASIQREFGFRLFNRLGANLQERLIHSERFLQACHDGDDALAYVRDLYAAVQATFDKAISGRLPPDVNDAQLIDLAERKAIEAGCCECLPKTLQTVKVLAIRQTLQGASQSLGACVLAWLLVADSDELVSINDLQPFWVKDMANLILHRGHGNEPLTLQQFEITKLRKAALTIIKTLLEH